MEGTIVENIIFETGVKSLQLMKSVIETVQPEDDASELDKHVFLAERERVLDHLFVTIDFLNLFGLYKNKAIDTAKFNEEVGLIL